MRHPDHDVTAFAVHAALRRLTTSPRVRLMRSWRKLSQLCPQPDVETTGRTEMPR